MTSSRKAVTAISLSGSVSKTFHVSATVPLTEKSCRLTSHLSRADSCRWTTSVSRNKPFSTVSLSRRDSGARTQSVFVSRNALARDSR